MGITIIGSLNYDLVTYTDRIPNAGETFRANSFETHAGGKGLNQTMAAAGLKHKDSEYPVRIIGSIGRDSFGDQLLEILKKNSVNVSALKRVENESTGTATIIVEELYGGQNRILLSKGANGKTVFTPDELDGFFDRIKLEDAPSKSNYVILQHEIPDPGSIILWLKKNYPNYEIVFNPSPFQPLCKEVWASVDVLIVNELEALQIAESLCPTAKFGSYQNEIQKDFLQGYRQICQDLQSSVICQDNNGIVVITLGSRGAIYSSKESTSVGYAPSLEGVKIVDTTGAGDTFLGALTTQLHQGSSLPEAVNFSSAASALTIQRKGAAESIPSYLEVCDYIREQPSRK